MQRIEAAIQIVRRLRRKPASYLLRRLWSEARVEGGRVATWARDRRFGPVELLDATEARSIDELWTRLAARPFPAAFDIDEAALAEYCPGQRERIARAAANAGARRVDLLGSGLTTLTKPIDWAYDFKAGRRWERGYALRMSYNDPELPSDVKVPWELSRVQWLLAAGQAFVLTGDESHAVAARDVLEEWIGANPYGYSIVWGVTMEVALRIVSWSWLFHAFAHSRAWSDQGFRGRFLRMLYLHGEFTEEYIERSDTNGNHYTADATGLLFAGLFFGRGVAPKRWTESAWGALCDELPKQVFPDGVDFEASAAYHRLVGELFYLGASFWRASGREVPPSYRERLTAMARFVAVSARPDGGAPLWGDGDDARALPLGGQPIDDHRHFVGQVATLFRDAELARAFSGPLDEVLWSAGRAGCAWLRAEASNPTPPSSRAFPDGGVYVMRSDEDYVFIDCGPVGLSGRGGHGHNDCLSFECALVGKHLVTDCGSYLYTASYSERNRFRSSASHNTPIIDGQELNRFSFYEIWVLQNDALPNARVWRSSGSNARFVGSHRGFERLATPVRPVRTFVLDGQEHRLLIHDRFEMAMGVELPVEIPLHLAAGVTVLEQSSDELLLESGGARFRLVFAGTPHWELTQTPARVAPRYGVTLPIVRLAWRGNASPQSELLVALAPEREDTGSLLRWARSALSGTGEVATV